MTPRQIVDLQLPQKRLCVPFNVFQGAISAVLGRAVYTHEFANAERIKQEVFNGAEPPTFEEILAMIPGGKEIIVI